jgi:hypothetical protein
MQNYKRFFTAGILMILFVALVMVAAGQANAREDGGGTANALPQNSTLGEPGVFLTGRMMGSRSLLPLIIFEKMLRPWD